jgi:hypothetical protein
MHTEKRIGMNTLHERTHDGQTSRPVGRRHEENDLRDRTGLWVYLDYDDDDDDDDDEVGCEGVF